MFSPNQIKTKTRPNIFTAPAAGIYSNAELDQFWNRILFSKHSDTTLQLFGKALSYSFISSKIQDYSDTHNSQTNPYNTLRIGLRDKLLNLTLLFTPSWFADAFITLFGDPCYILTQCGIYFSTFPFIQALLTLLIKVCKIISINYNLEQNITIFSSIAHGFFNILTSEMTNETLLLKKSIGSEQNFFKIFCNDYRKPIRQTSIISDYPSDNLQLSPKRNNDTQNLNMIKSPPPFYTKRPTRKLSKMSKLEFLPKRQSYNTITIDNSKPVTQSVSHPPLPHYINVTSKSDTYQLNSTPLDNTETETLVKIFSKTNCFFHHLLKIGYLPQLSVTISNLFNKIVNTFHHFP